MSTKIKGRPEPQIPPELFYNDREAEKYTSSSRITHIQRELAERALELLNFPAGTAGKCILDVGCGSGLSGEVLNEAGHIWVGSDISQDMLSVGVDRGTEGDMMLHDMGQGLPFRHGVFDGAISISALQWLCYSHKKCDVPKRRLVSFFRTLYDSLKRGARAVLQFYPESAEHLDLITTCATACGFTGGVIVDFPNSTKAKKFYLCINAGEDEEGDGPAPLPAALSADGQGAEAGAGGAMRHGSERDPRNRFKFGRGKKLQKKSKEWIKAKKERQRAQGKAVRNDSKFTGRRRSRPF